MVAAEQTVTSDQGFQERLDSCIDEIRDLYFQLYPDNHQGLNYFINMLRYNWDARKPGLRELDERRLDDPHWYLTNTLVGMMLYPAKFARTLQGVQSKLPYFQELGINYIHLMPLLQSPKGRSDGGYAVSDFRAVQPELGTMDDLESLCDACRTQDVSVCLDFVMNHTSEDHEWARQARQGDPYARGRYFFYDNWDIPREFERTVPQVFPTTAPGNFTQLPDDGSIVMTTFYPYQWDLNYSNSMVFNDMTDNLLYLANRGVNIIRLDAVPYIWKQLGTDNRNLPQVHTLVRLMHLACEVVCPSVMLLGEVVMEPSKVAPYFGSVERPECHMLYNVTSMCTTWHTIATRDTRLLVNQLREVSMLEVDGLFQNYLRCHDDIGWGLDYPALAAQGIEETAHKGYLNGWFTGLWPGSWSRGELYNNDERAKDARLCGTTASLTGIEVGEKAEDEILLTQGIQCDVMLHAWLLSQSGIPVIYSGDEIAQLNDYGYHGEPDRMTDSRYLHRGKFQWSDEGKRHDPATVQGRVFQSLQRLIAIRKREPVFRSDARIEVLDGLPEALLAFRRSVGDDSLVAIFNFSEFPQRVTLHLEPMKDLITGEIYGVIPKEGEAEGAEEDADPRPATKPNTSEADDLEVGADPRPEAKPGTLEAEETAEVVKAEEMAESAEVAEAVESAEVAETVETPEASETAEAAETIPQDVELELAPYGYLWLKRL